MVMRLLSRLLIALLCLVIAACAALPDVSNLSDVESTTTSTSYIAPTSASLLATKLQHTQVNLQQLAALEKTASNSPVITGNKVTLLFDGPETTDAMMVAIANAKSHINFETYIFDQDELGQRFADLLIAKQRAGVQVNIIYDSVGTIGTPSEFFERMRNAGIHLVEFNPVNPLKRFGRWRLNNRDHRKILIVDGKIAFTGGVNISAAYANSSLFRAFKHPHPATATIGWRDTHIQIEGPAVAQLQLAFLRNWVRQRTGTSDDTETLEDLDYFPALPLAGDKALRVLTSRPGGDYALYKTYILAIRNAKQTIHITTPYFAPDPQMLQELLNAAHRGVKVVMIFPSVSDSGLVFQAGQSYYDQLLDAGIKIYQLRAAVLHAKTAVIDGTWSTVGSANLDIRSFLHNYEANVVVLDAAFGGEMESAFSEDISNADEISAESWNRRSMTQRIKEWIAQTLKYWL
ncbi:cardiolipin synthase [Glaciimonas soli]|uniref:Cardiolipin synthase n=1 Tax=Glaciimonas soli TaxID=2590999 RepID=A0A843YY65_9BURK|nr:cardiolipin synthase [Glaciimonas soli]MQR01476.1 cardiolipin synthase [Glaciimonas soli]